MAKDPALPAGSVYLAEDQTAGRGQGGNSWHSSPGANLTFSLLLRPDRLAVSRLFCLTQLVSLAVVRALRPLLPASAPLSVKWPNDVYCGDRKLAGILIQNALRGEWVKTSVVGIGLNVNEAAFPPALSASATSLRLVTGRSLDLGDTLQRVLEAIAEGYAVLERHDYAALAVAYRGEMYRIDREGPFLRTGATQSFRATVRGVDGAGRLLLEHSDGSVEAYELRSLRWLPDAPIPR